MVLMRGSVRGRAMRASKVQVITDKKGIPMVIRDTEPFHIEVWRSEEGIEFFNNYYLAFSFRGGLYVEVTHKPVYPPEFSEGTGELYQGSLSLDQLDEEALRKLRKSQELGEDTRKGQRGSATDDEESGRAVL
jgi:hypothetical protein